MDRSVLQDSTYHCYSGKPPVPSGRIGRVAHTGRFYADELQKVKYDPRQEFAVEAILDRRRRRVGRKTVSEVLEQWRGYPDKYNTWEP